MATKAAVKKASENNSDLVEEKFLPEKLEDTTPRMREEKKRILAPGAFRMAEHARDLFSAVIPANHDIEDVMEPGYWVNIVDRLKKNSVMSMDRDRSIIELTTMDHAFFAQLYICNVMATGMIVQCIGPAIDEDGKCCPVDLETGKAWTGRKDIESDSYIAVYNPAKKGHDIKFKPNNQVMVDGSKIPTRAMARKMVAELS